MLLFSTPSSVVADNHPRVPQAHCRTALFFIHPYAACRIRSLSFPQPHFLRISISPQPCFRRNCSSVCPAGTSAYGLFSIWFAIVTFMDGHSAVSKDAGMAACDRISRTIFCTPHNIFTFHQHVCMLCDHFLILTQGMVKLLCVWRELVHRQYAEIPAGRHIQEPEDPWHGAFSHRQRLLFADSFSARHGQVSRSEYPFMCILRKNLPVYAESPLHPDSNAKQYA